MAFVDPQKPYTTSVNARYTETWHLDGHVRTGTQVLAFSNEIVAKTPALLVHWFQFEFNSVLYEFKLVGDQTKGIDTKADFTAMIDPSDLSTCWMHGHQLVVHPWVSDDDD